MTKVYLFILLGAFIICGCSSGEQTKKIFLQAESLLDEHPDSALHLLQTFPATQELSRKKTARYALLLAQATDKCEKSLLPCDSLLNIALEYYDEEEKERAVALLYKGRVEVEMNSSKEAIAHLQEGLMILNDFPKEIETKRHILSSLGNLYFNAKYYNESIKMYRELYKYCETDKDKSIALNNISTYYTMIDREDSAIIQQSKALEYALNSGDSSIISNSLLSLSIDYYQIDELDSALLYAQKAITYLPKQEPEGRYYFHLGDLLSEMGNNIDSAYFYINKSMEDNSFENKYLGLYSMSHLEMEKGNFKEAIDYLETYIEKLDSIASSEQSTKVQQLIYGYNTKIKVKEEQLKGQRTQLKIIVFSCIFCFLIILIYQNRINRKKRQQLDYKQTLNEVENKLASLQTIIDNNQSIISILHQERYDFEEEQRNKEKQIRESEQTIIKLQEEKLQLRNWLFTQSDIYKRIKTLSNQKDTDKKKIKVFTVAEQSKLRETLFSIYTEFINNLQKTYPRLTEDDLLLLCLQETSLSSQTIAICFGYSDTHPINQRKFRIKERMGLSKTEV